MSLLGNIERTNGPFQTKVGEFFMSSSGSQVKSGLDYVIHYMKNKDVVYELVSTQERIRRSKEVVQEAYTRVASTIDFEVEPVQVFPTIKKLNFDAKYITRIFAKSKIEKDADILEVESVIKNASYTFTKIQWQISGEIEQARKFNETQLMIAEKSMSGIMEKYNPLQLHESRLLSKESEIDRLKQNPNYDASNIGSQSNNVNQYVLKRKKRIGRKRKKKRKTTTSSRIY